MGRCIVTRNAQGVCFLLESASKMALATSRTYKNLDACKKGIASLAETLPEAPVVDAAAGERAPNPKIELVASGEGYAFLVKAPNGKVVITSPVYATKKAAKRAISMLRTAVLDLTLVLAHEAGVTPLTMKKTPQRGVTPKSEVSGKPVPTPVQAVELPVSPLENSTPAVLPAEEDFPPDFVDFSAEDLPAGEAAERSEAEPLAKPDGAPVKAEPPAEQTEAEPPAAYRLMRVGEARGTAPRGRANSPAEKTGKPAAGRTTLLSRVLGRK